jgi:tetratricopeptide (TPR) repeat protein
MFLTSAGLPQARWFVCLRSAAWLMLSGLLSIVASMPASTASADTRDRSRSADELYTARAIALEALAASQPVLREIVADLPNAQAVRLVVAAQSLPRSEAEQNYRSALALLSAETERPHRWGLLYLLGQLHLEHDEAQSARQFIHQAYDLARQDCPANSPAVFYTALLMAWIHGAAELKAEAAALLQQAEGLIERRTARAERPGDRTADRSEIGQLWVQLGEVGRGGQHLRHAVGSADFERMSDYLRARTLSRLAEVDAWQGNAEQALKHYQTALAYWRMSGQLPPPDWRDIAAVEARVGDLYAQRDDLASAVYHYQKSAEIYAATKDLQRRAEALLEVGKTLLAQGREAEARAPLGEAYAYYKRADPNTLQTATAAAVYGHILLLLEDHAAAEPLLREALATYRRLAVNNAAMMAAYLLGRTQALAGRACEAQHSYRQARALLGGMSETDRARYAETVRFLMLNGDTVICNP